MTNIFTFKHRLLFFIIAAATVMSIPNLYAQNLIASYPLTTNSNDATGNFGPVQYGTTATQAPNACSDGTINGNIITPSLGSMLNTSNFQISMTFTVRNIPTSGGATPVFMLDNSYRTFGVSYNTSRVLGVYWNNINFAPSGTAINVNQTYTVTAKYVAPNVEIYLDDQLIQSRSIGPLTFNPNNASHTVCTYNGANGQYANECIRNLQVYSGNVFVLPIALASFKATVSGDKQVLLEWESQHEFAGEVFAIERSLDAQEWKEIGTVAARGLKTNSKYTFVDAAPVPDRNNYHRLRYEQQGGTKSYTAVEKVHMGSQAIAYKVYPNPVADMLHVINWNTGKAKVYDLSGKAVMLLTIGSDGRTDVSRLKAGMYVLEIIADGSRHHIRFQKL